MMARHRARNATVEMFSDKSFRRKMNGSRINDAMTYDIVFDMLYHTTPNYEEKSFAG
jgi:hypothetical protein